MKLGILLKTKLLSIILASVAVTGGAVAVATATPAGQHALHTLTGQAEATATSNDHNDNNQHKTCAGEPDAKNLATKFSLSTDSSSDALKAICELHAGTFKGTTPDDKSVTASRVYGYGEIEMLLTYAQYLAGGSGKLTTDNARSYLAEALQNCGNTPLEPCLQKKIPGYQPGNSNGNNTDNGKPTALPTPPTPPAHPDPTPRKP